MAKLKLMRGPSKHLEFDLRPKDNVIGRDSDADICLPEEWVSRPHAKIGFRGNEYYIVDLKSRN